MNQMVVRSAEGGSSDWDGWAWWWRASQVCQSAVCPPAYLRLLSFEVGGGRGRGSRTETHTGAQVRCVFKGSIDRHTHTHRLTDSGVHTYAGKDLTLA